MSTQNPSSAPDISDILNEAEAGAESAAAGQSPPPPPAASSSPPPAAASASPLSPPESLSAWAAAMAVTLGQQLLGAAPDAQTLSTIEDLLTQLAMVSLSSIGTPTNSPAGAAVLQKRTIILSALQDLGVVGTVAFDAVATQAVGKLFAQVADFAMQGLTAALPGAVAAL